MNDQDIRDLLDKETESFDLPAQIPPDVLKRARLRRGLGTFKPIAAVLAAVLLPITALNVFANDGSDRRDQISAPPQSESAPSSPPQRFVPPVSRDGETVHLTVLFPDGTTTQLTYDAPLRFEELGISGGTALVDFSDASDSRTPCLSELHVSFGDPKGSFYKGDKPVIVYDETPTKAEVWHGVGGSRYALVLRIGAWVVSSHCDAVPPNDATIVTNLLGRESEDGFLILEATEPLRLTGPTAPEGGSSLFFGREGKLVQIAPADCTPVAENRSGSVESFEGGAVWCLDDGMIHVTAYGPRPFLHRLSRDLSASNTRFADP